ncbi:MAG TPA: ABC-type transport auxiliary lipoprotein family protein [Solimonas sp.]|nr:ABC-type transport auxiliary lipoprotein family protein [Solimonas sp.]
MRLWMRLLAVAVVLLAACASDPPPPDRYFRLEPVAAAAATGGSNVHVVVEPFEAHGVYSERPLIFRRTDLEHAPLEQFNYHFWAEPPSILFGDLLADHLRGVYGERNVFRSTSRVRPDLVVRPRLRGIEQVLGAGGAQAHLAVQFVVTDDLHAPLLVLDFDESEKLAGTAPEEYVGAINRMAQRACASLAQKLAGLRP